MINRIKDILAIIATVISIVAISYLLISFYSFKSQGKRFTAEDGYKLCLRINTLEIKNGIEPIECK